MPLMVRVRWFAFATYIALLCALPPSLLWGMPGAVAGAILAVGTLAWLRHRGVSRLCTILGAQPLCVAHHPSLHALVKEYCRRLKLNVPGIQIIEAQGLNVGVVGFSSQDVQLIFTRGALENLNRQLLAAIVARALCRVWGAEVSNETWLARFFSALHLLTTPPTKVVGSLSPAYIAKQVLCYPLALFPAFVLKGHSDESLLDRKSVEITQDPQSLAEAFRRMEALAERIPFQPPFSCRHLFLAAPSALDPMARIFFASADLGDRIRHAENRFRVQPSK